MNNDKSICIDHTCADCEVCITLELHKDRDKKYHHCKCGAFYHVYKNLVRYIFNSKAGN